jgi:hypothetical protein
VELESIPSTSRALDGMLFEAEIPGKQRLAFLGREYAVTVTGV